MHKSEFNGPDTSGSDTRMGPRQFRIAVLAVTAVLAGVSFLKVPVPGINEPHYLTKARAFLAPDWCPQDFFLQSANAHFVFFALTAPLTKIFPFAVVASIGRLLSLFTLAVGWCMTGRRLGASLEGLVFAAATFCGIALTGNLSGEWVIGGFEGKVPSYGFALMGVAVWMDGWQSRRHARYFLAGGLLGIAVSLHPVVGGWFCVGIVFAELLMLPFRGLLPSTLNTCGLLKFLGNGLALTTSAILFALPGVIPAAKMILSSELSPEKADRANYIQVFWRLAHHLDPSTFPIRAWVHTAVVLLVGSVSMLTVFFIRRRRNCHSVESGDAATPSSNSFNWQPMFTLLFTSAVITGIGVFVGWHSKPVLELPDWQWRASVLKFYPFRFFDALLPMTAAFVLGILFDTLTTRIRVWSRREMAAVLVLIVLAAANEVRPLAPAGYTPETFATWQEACRWLKDNTKPAALVFGPREGFGLKWFSERSEYVCFKDCPQDGAGILEWNSRLWTIHRWSESSYQDQKFDLADTVKLREKTGVTHILTRQLGPFEQPPVYQNKFWRVYEISPKAPTAD